LNFDFNSRNWLDSTRFSIPTLGIDSPRLSDRVDSNRQDSGRLIDPNSINRPEAVSLSRWWGRLKGVTTFARTWCWCDTFAILRKRPLKPLRYVSLLVFLQNKDRLHDHADLIRVNDKGNLDCCWPRYQGFADPYVLIILTILLNSKTISAWKIGFSNITTELHLLQPFQNMLVDCLPTEHLAEVTSVNLPSAQTGYVPFHAFTHTRW